MKKKEGGATPMKAGRGEREICIIYVHVSRNGHNNTNQTHDHCHYTKLTVVRVSVRPENITGSNLTPVQKLAFFASLSFDVTEAVGRKS